MDSSIDKRSYELGLKQGAILKEQEMLKEVDTLIDHILNNIANNLCLKEQEIKMIYGIAKFHVDKIKEIQERQKRLE